MAKLLFVSTVASFLEAFLLPYARHFSAMGWRVDAVANGAPTNPSCTAAFGSVFDVEWTRNPLDARNLTTASDRLKQIVTEGRYDIVHVHTPVAAFVTRLALRSRSAPAVIYTAHGLHFHQRGTAARNAIFLAMELLAGRWTDYLIVINKPDLQVARRWRMVEPDRVLYMPGIGVDVQSSYAPERVSDADVHRVRAEQGVADDAPVFLKVAEFIPRKRHSDALNAFAALRRAHSHLLLAGTGPLVSDVERQADRLGIRRRVHFLGQRTDVPVLMKCAKAVLLCSDQEGLPRSVLEAMALGTPVIGTDIRGTQELLSDGAGFLYQPGDDAALADLMRKVLDDSESALRAVRVARQKVVLYDLRTVIRMHEELYHRLLGFRQPPMLREQGV